MYDTKLFMKKEIKTSVPNLRFLDNKGNEGKEKPTKNEKIKLTELDNNILTCAPYVLFNTFMTMEIHNMTNMFYYYVLNNSIKSFYNIDKPIIYSNEKNMISPSDKEMFEVYKRFGSMSKELREKVNTKEARKIFKNMNSDTGIEEEGILPFIVPIIDNKLDHELIKAFLENLIAVFSPLVKKKAHPALLLRLCFATHEPLPFLKDNRKFIIDAFNEAIPVMIKIYERLRIQSLVIHKLKEFLKIKIHGVNHDFSKLSKAVTYSIDFSENERWPKNYVELRPTSDSYVPIDPETRMLKSDIPSDKRPKYEYEYLIECLMHSLTSDKIKKSYNNQYFEFLGDGVLSIFLSWHLIMNNPNSKDVDVDKLRIENSSSKKLLEIAISDENTFEEYLIHPQYKLLEYYCPPTLKKSHYFSIKHFEINDEFTKLNEELWEKYKEVKELDHQEEDEESKESGEYEFEDDEEEDPDEGNP